MIKLVKKYLKGYRLITLLGPLSKLLESAIEIILPLIVADIINVGIKKLADPAYVWRGGMLMLALYALSFGFALVCQYLAAKSASGFGSNLRRGLYSHINSLPLAQIDRFQTSTLITRISLDSSNVQNALNRFIRLVTRAPFILIGSLIMAIRINAPLSLIFFGASALLLFALLLIMSRTAPRLKKINQSHDKITLLTRENLSGARVVRAVCAQNQEETEFRSAAKDLKKQSVALGLITALSSPLSYLIINAGIILLVYFGAFQVSYGKLQDGDIIALINYMTQILNSMLVIAMLVNLFAKAGASAKRINAVLDTPSEDDGGEDIGREISEGIGGSTLSAEGMGVSSNILADFKKANGFGVQDNTLTDFKKANGFGVQDNTLSGGLENAPADIIRFEDVSVFYAESSSPSLSNISFSLRRGQTLGIIGGTGSGKTTLVSLIPKLYAYEGKITLCGRDLKALSAKSVRDAVSFVSQKAVLFSGTVRDNMLIARPDATDKEIMDALKTAECGFIKSPAAITARGGANFSGGQRQRLSLAQGILKKPLVLILDDAMSALDYSTEAAIKKRLNRLDGLTKIIVTQRAGSIKNADLILVLEGGRAVGIGSHDSLLESCDAYREINEIQGGTL